MDACELIRLVINKKIVPTEPKRAGNPGYGYLKAIRVLVYARLKGLQNDTRIICHLKKHPSDAAKLGLHSIPDRTTIGRWWRRYLTVLEEAFQKTAKIIQMLVPTTHLIADSTPLVDPTIWKPTEALAAEDPSKASNYAQSSTNLDYPSKPSSHQATVLTPFFCLNFLRI